jgi:hypothetical protein
VGALIVTGLWSVLFPALRNTNELTAAALRRDTPSADEDELVAARSD